MEARNAFEIMHEPVASLLGRHGIEYRVKHDGAVTWHNMAPCPACGHTGYQCGISESAGTDGKLIHGVKCFHPHDNPWNEANPEYEDFLCKLGALTGDEREQVRTYVAKLSVRSAVHIQVRSPEPLRLLNPDFHGKLKKRLRENGAALQYLFGRGLQLETIASFGLGLSTPYVSRRSNEEQSDALVYPMRGRDGQFYNKYAYYYIPEVTKNPVDQNGWMSGEVRTYYADAVGQRNILFVCEGAKDLWRTWQEIQNTPLASDLLLITSTHGSSFPAEWKNLAFWAGWDVIFFGQDSDGPGDTVAVKLAQLVGRDARRVLVPQRCGKDWTDFWQNGGTLEEFTSLLHEAPMVTPKLSEGDGEADDIGEFAYDPVDINGAFHNGHLYYPVRILKKNVELVGDMVTNVEWLETVVVRSDRTYHYAKSVQSPQGKRPQDRVLRLDDGTLIDKEPQPNKYGTWSWSAIKAYLAGRSQTRSLAEILHDVREFLRGSVWLPYEEDYALLTLTVPVTYAQSIFDSVPLLFLNGPAGSGKSQMGRAMARLCANAYVCGTASAASIARFIDESRGFVVLDDLEVIGNKGGEFGELVQGLKQSYNKDTAVKLWTDVKTMRTMKLNFYGVKMINNTQGADDILGSRMLHIQTRKIPAVLKERFQGTTTAETQRLSTLRDELHTWTFENISRIDEEYRKLFPKRTDRSEEITAPLRVFASLAADADLKSQMEIALIRQQHKTMNPDNPEAILIEALRGLVAQGYDHVSTTHLVLEMRSMTHRDLGKSFTTEIPEWSRPDWVGRMLRSHDLIDQDPTKHKRERLFGAHLRTYPIGESFIQEVRCSYAKEGTEIQIGTKRATEFCRGCSGCPYMSLNCDIMERRLQIEGRGSE